MEDPNPNLIPDPNLDPNLDSNPNQAEMEDAVSESASLQRQVGLLLGHHLTLYTLPPTPHT